MSSETKKLGCCTICDRETFEVLRRYPAGHPCEGDVIQVGLPLPDARRTTLLLSDGSRMDLTLCGDCQIRPENLPDVWRKVCASWAQQIDPAWREKRRLPPVKGGNTASAHLLRQMKMIPLGVLYSQLWSDVDA